MEIENPNSLQNQPMLQTQVTNINTKDAWEHIIWDENSKPNIVKTMEGIIKGTQGHRYFLTLTEGERKAVNSFNHGSKYFHSERIINPLLFANEYHVKNKLQLNISKGEILHRTRRSAIIKFRKCTSSRTQGHEYHTL